MTQSLSQAIRASLANFEGKAVSMLSEASLAFRDDSKYAHALISLFDDIEENTQIGASWLWLDHVKTHRQLPTKDLDALSTHLEDLTSWMAALHVFQALDAYDSAHPIASDLAAFCRSYLSHDRPFLRAWSMNALCRLALVHDDLKPDADRARKAALIDEAASVRARARKAPSR